MKATVLWVRESKKQKKQRQDKTQAKFLIKEHLEAPSFFCKASESLMQKLLRKGNYPKKKLLCSAAGQNLIIKVHTERFYCYFKYFPSAASTMKTQLLPPLCKTSKQFKLKPSVNWAVLEM